MDGSLLAPDTRTTASAASWLERFPLPHAGQRNFVHWSARALRSDAPIASGSCATPRPPLRWCVPTDAADVIVEIDCTGDDADEQPMASPISCAFVSL